MSGFVYRLFQPAMRHRLLARFKGWVYVCTTLRADAIAGLDWEFLQKTRSGDAVPLPPDHWLPRLIADPSGTGPSALEWLTWEETLKSIEYQRCMHGAGVLWTPSSPGEPDTDAGPYPVQMWFLPASAVTPVSGEGGLVDHWRWTHPRGVKILSRREVCYLPVLAPSDSLYQSLTGGYSLAGAAIDAIEADEATIQFIADHFRQGGVPPMVLEELPGAEENELDTPEAYEAWRETWKQRAQGADGAPIAKLPSGWTLKTVDLVSNLKGMLGIADKTMEMIANVFRVPISRLRSNAANYATAKVNDYQFRVDGVEPEAKTIEAVLTRHFRKYDPTVIVRHVPAINDDPAEQREQMRFLLDSGVVTPNDVAAYFGLEPIPAEQGGDTYFKSNKLVPVSSILKAAEKPEEKTPTPSTATIAPPPTADTHDESDATATITESTDGAD